MSDESTTPPTSPPEPTEAEAPATGASPTEAAGSVKDGIVAILKTVYDPEIPVDIYELGLIYEAEVDAEGKARIRMTLTSPMCPVAETLPPEVEAKVRSVPGVSDVELELVWDPPWSPAMMTEAARLELGMV